MKAIVRDDLITIDNYIAAEFKYKKYIELLFESGGYCFLKQFNDFIERGPYIVHKMLENNLIKVEYLNNCYKYIYLTETSCKYIQLRDSDKDYSNIPKNRINVKKFDKYPTQKILIMSAFMFHLKINGEKIIEKEDLKDTFYNFLINKNFKNNYTKNKLDNIKESYTKTIQENNNSLHEINNVVAALKEQYNICKNNMPINEIEERYSICIEQINELKLQKDKIDKSMFKNNLKIVSNDLNMYNEGLKCIESYKKQMVNTLYCMEKHIALKISEIEKIEKETEEYTKTKDIINNVYKTASEIMDENNLVKKIDNLFGISKIMVKVIQENILEFNIFDCSQFSKSDVYINHIKSLLIKHDYTHTIDYYRDKQKYDRKYYYDEIQINIYSYAKHRSINLYKDLCNKIKDNLIDKIPVTITVKEDMYYINKYISNTSNTDMEIKMQDRKSIEKLKNELNNL